MPTIHAVGYSKSTRAKCHTPPPCKDTPLPVNTLRYGQTITTDIGETVEWRHWGCVTPEILAQLATAPEITGFESLKLADQNKIRLAISLRRVDPSDVPASAKRAEAAMSSSVPTQKKRNAKQAGLVQGSQIPRSVPGPRFLTQTREIEDESTDQEPEVVDELYCAMGTNVVGIQYYKGLVGPGEEVVLVREPHNPYDRNAIQVKNISRIQVGHVPKNVAAKLAPLLDRKAVTVEGVINDGNLGGSKSWSLSLTLKIYGPSDKRSELEPALIWATPHQRGFPAARASSSVPANRGINKAVPLPPTPSTSQRPGNPQQLAAQQEAIQKRQQAVHKQQEALQKAAELRQMLNSLEKVDDEGRRTSLLDTLCSTDDVLAMPVHENPPGLASGELNVDLLKHQLQALKWCIERENPVLPKKETDKPVQFWQLRKRGYESYYFNIATKTPQTAPPLLGRGALCADAMGLGKTLTMIALILATKNEVDPGFSNSTLIVAPLSVLSNWEKQLLDHCTPGTLSSCVYYGTNRGLSATELQTYDVVITTYQTIVGEYDDGTNAAGGSTKKKKKMERVLFDVPWKRVILDEGHNIRNPKTKMAKSVGGLNVSRRWVLTGTPIINSPRDLGSLLTFLQICRPLDNEDFYKRLLLRPLKNGESSGVELLRALMSHICIRRTKEMQDSDGNSIIELPPVEMIKVPVTLSDEARRLYDEVERVSQQRLENFMEAGSTAMVQSNVLSMLTRMRQIALHPGLVPANYLEELRKAEASEGNPRPMEITPAAKLRLQGLLAQAIEDSEECPICFGLLPDDARITTCAHTFCLACITETLSRDPKCPLDRRTLTVADLHEPPPQTDLTQRPVRYDNEGDEPEGVRAGSSAKIDQLVHLLKLTPGTEKSLVFSQFTSFLDKIAESLESEGIPYVRFDGQMSAKRRQEAIARFSIPLDEEAPALPMTSRTARRTTTTKAQQDTIDEDNASSDFVMDNDSDDFIDDDDDDSPFSGKKSRSKGKGKAKAKSAVSSQVFPTFDSSGENPRVMLLSLKAGALGLNLTVANNVYLMDPWWQEGIESQAVDRVNRIGQKKNVHVYQLIAEDTVESKVLEIQEKKKTLIQQAFSGIKRTETQRQQREARFQDLVELFGIRRQNSQGS